MFGDAVLARLDRIWPNEALLAGQGGPPGSPEAAPAGSVLPKTVSVISGGRDAKSPPWVVLVSRRHAAAEEGVAAPEITVEPGHGVISHATWISLAAACCSGLVLYSIKHRTTVMDAEIGRTFRATKAAHDSTAILKVEWAALNEPTRLQTMASQYLTLKATIPSQFVALTDLPGKLPAPGTIIPGPMPPVTPLKAPPPRPRTRHRCKTAPRPCPNWSRAPRRRRPRPRNKPPPSQHPRHPPFEPPPPPRPLRQSPRRLPRQRPTRHTFSLPMPRPRSRLCRPARQCPSPCRRSAPPRPRQSPARRRSRSRHQPARSWPRPACQRHPSRRRPRVQWPPTCKLPRRTRMRTHRCPRPVPRGRRRAPQTGP